MQQRRVVRVFLVCALSTLVGCLPARADLLPRRTTSVVKVGLVAPFEGRYRALGYEVLYAVKWALQERNLDGASVGYAFELVALNDDDDPARSSFQALKFAADSDVLGVIGPFSDSTWLAAAPAYAERGLPLVSPAGCLEGGSSQIPDGVFCLGPDAAQLASELLARAGPRSVLMRGERDGGALSDAVRAQGTQTFGEPWDVAGIARDLARGAEAESDGTGSAGRTVAPAVDVVLFDGDVLAAARALVSLRGAGIEAPLWGGPALGRAQLAQIAGRSAAGACYVIAAPVSADLSPSSTFADGYRTLSGVDPGPWAALAYDAAQLLLDGIERAAVQGGHPTRTGVRAALTEARGQDGAGLFVSGRRTEVELAWYCYDGETAYPGRRRVAAAAE
jgi:branched-chain amino acid transport system substrate-binding protein